MLTQKMDYGFSFLFFSWLHIAVYNKHIANHERNENDSTSKRRNFKICDLTEEQESFNSMTSVHVSLLCL